MHTIGGDDTNLAAADLSAAVHRLREMGLRQWPPGGQADGPPDRRRALGPMDQMARTNRLHMG